MEACFDKERVLVIRDMNARVGNSIVEGVMGKLGVSGMK